MPYKRLLALTLTTLSAPLLLALPAQASEPDWKDAHTGHGYATISGGRKDLHVCDTKTDNLRVGIEYTTSIGRTLVLSAGPRSECVDDSVFFGRITTAKFCYGVDLNSPNGLRWCQPPSRLI